ncbi:phage holin family protein [Erythrobacter sp. CCH5-A1]|jgi:hypothetical protein|uniref:phage holin family protein n=1 Tax=Erythrobacter sp. CCH5-A1 TaxID=1768792 RepID=UPI0008361AEA|nr:phage holin family protein [Erythrobacter sp. CCH5-A1]
MADIDPGLARPQDGAPAEPAPDAPEAPDTTLSALRDDVTALVEDARNYAEAEIAFQKTRAALAGKHGARALGMLVLALVLLHIALIALAVGAVIALAPLVTIWGAIAIVVGVMLIGVAVLVMSALKDGKLLAAMFGSGDAS